MISTVKIKSQLQDGIINSAKRFDWPRSGRGGGHANAIASIGQVLASNKDVINRYFRTRAFFAFDTSGIPDQATILHVRLLLWGSTKANAKVVAQKGLQGLVLNGGNYVSFSGPEYGHTDWKTDHLNTIDFNTQGIGAINRSGMTFICCREYEHDFLNNPPPPGQEFSASFFMSNVEDATKHPCLEISYELREEAERFLPTFKGFSIDLLEARVTLNIQDVSGHKIQGAVVSLNCAGTFATGVTDNDGCVSIPIHPNRICDITVSKACYKPYQGKFVVLFEEQLIEPSKNFAIKVINASGAPLVNANVSILSQVHSETGLTDNQGFFKGKIENDYMNELSILKPGYTNYQQAFNSFSIINCQNAGMRLVSVITLNQ